MKRQRGRNNRRNNNNNGNNNNPNRSLDSNGPDVKIRGSAATIYEKYTNMARDAKTSGNRVKADSDGGKSSRRNNSRRGRERNQRDTNDDTGSEAQSSDDAAPQTVAEDAPKPVKAKKDKATDGSEEAAPRKKRAPARKPKTEDTPAAETAAE